MTTALGAKKCSQQEKFYFQSDVEFSTVLNEIKRHYTVEQVYGGKWATIWCIDGEEIAAHEIGLNYGHNNWIKRSYVGHRQYDFVTSRFLTFTEVHILNNRLWYGRDKDVRLLPEVESVYRQCVDAGIKRVGELSAHILWTETRFPTECRPFVEYVE